MPPAPRGRCLGELSADVERAGGGGADRRLGGAVGAARRTGTHRPRYRAELEVHELERPRTSSAARGRRWWHDPHTVARRGWWNRVTGRGHKQNASQHHFHDEPPVLRETRTPFAET